MNPRATFRRLACALRGSGPWRLAPFADIARDRTSYAGGVHRAEDFTGLLHSEPGGAAFYPPGTSLLNQPATCETLPDGPRYRGSGVAPVPARQVFALCDAGVLSSEGVVYCRRSRRAVAETVLQWTAPAAEHPLLGAAGYPAARPLPGLSLSLLTLGGEGFYHFLLESIPRLRLLRPWFDRADHVLSPGRPDGLHARWLAHAGVPLAKVVWMDGLCHVACEQVLFTSAPMRNYQPDAWVLRAVRETFPPPPPSPGAPRRLWISRRDAQLRQISWEDELLARLPGFTRIELGGLSPAEQTALAAGADVIAGPHGAGLSHVVFGRPGARVVELFPHARRQPVYARLAALAGLDYAWAVADFDRAPDLPALAAAINAFCPPSP